MATQSRVFNTNNLSIGQIAQGAAYFLQTEKKLYAEVISTGEGMLVQAKSQDGWKNATGMGAATQVQIIPNTSNDSVTVNVGSGEWVDKAGAATVGMLVFWPLAITSGIGAWRQHELPEEIFNFVQRFIMSGGNGINVASIPITGAQAPMPPVQGAPVGATITCANCNAQWPEGTKFCENCGTKLEAVVPPVAEATIECANCHAQIAQDSKFCLNCGEKVVAAPTSVTCPECSTDWPAGTKFCAECGHSFAKDNENDADVVTE